jgi:hypothetical protein
MVPFSDALMESQWSPVRGRGAPVRSSNVAVPSSDVMVRFTDDVWCDCDARGCGVRRGGALE